MAAYDAYMIEIGWEHDEGGATDFETPPPPLKLTGQIFPRSTP